MWNVRSGYLQSEDGTQVRSGSRAGTLNPMPRRTGPSWEPGAHGHGATPEPHTPVQELTVVLGDQGFGKGPESQNSLRLESRETGRQVCANGACSYVCGHVPDACVSIGARILCMCMDVSMCDRGVPEAAWCMHRWAAFVLFTINTQRGPLCARPTVWRVLGMCVNRPTQSLSSRSHSLAGFIPIRSDTLQGICGRFSWWDVLGGEEAVVDMQKVGQVGWGAAGGPLMPGQK